MGQIVTTYEAHFAFFARVVHSPYEAYGSLTLLGEKKQTALTSVAIHQFNDSAGFYSIKTVV